MAHHGVMFGVAVKLWKEDGQLRADAGRQRVAAHAGWPQTKKAPPEWGAFFSIIT